MNRRACLPRARALGTVLVAFASFELLGCAGGNGNSGTAGTSGGAAGMGGGSGVAGNAGGTTGSAGNGVAGTTGAAGNAAGTGGSVAGTTGSGGSTGLAGSGAGAGGSAAGAGGSAAGTGGSAAGTGGSAAGAGGSAAGATGTGGLAANAIIVQDNFDSTAAAGPADPAKWTAYPQGQTNLEPIIDTAQHKSGANSARATSSSSGLGSFLVPVSGLPVTGNAFYVRVWINWQKATTAISGHSGFIVGSSARDESGTEVRLGISSKGPGGTPRMDLNLQNPMDSGGEVTRYSDGFTDGGNPSDFTTTGYQFAAGTWTCVEAFFNGAASGSEFRVWINDGELTDMHVTDFSANNSGRTHWAPTYSFIKIGAQDYDANLGEIWYDDVVVATQRIGCSYVVP